MPRVGAAAGLYDGDVLVAYTDGVVEALNPQREEFGEERLRDIVRSSLSLGAAEICRRIAERLMAVNRKP
ncbi:MAG: SpoIIE family protein phosphatase [Bryobacteraceae bacterium]